MCATLAATEDIFLFPNFPNFPNLPNLRCDKSDKSDTSDTPRKSVTLSLHIG